MTGSVNWLTPKPYIDELGPFDLDPCAPVEQPFPTAARVFTIHDNGLIQSWRGDDGDLRVWLNPPYARHLIAKWMARLAEHGRGTALVNASTDTEWFARYVWPRAHGLRFIKGRIPFLGPDGMPRMRPNGVNPMTNGEPSVLCAYGLEDMDRLASCPIEGTFVPLRLPRSVLVSIFLTDELVEKTGMTWRDELKAYFADRPEPVDLAQLYRDFANHPKAKANPNYQAKLRQQLQLGDFKRVGSGRWERVTRDSNGELTCAS